MKFFVGAYTAIGGAGVSLMEAKNGRLTTLSTSSLIGNPIYLALSRDKTALYSCAVMGERGKGAVASFRVEEDRLSPLCLQPAGGDEVCHVALSPEEDYLYSANYLSGSVSVFPVHDGYIFPKEQLLRHKGGSGVVPDRQEASHPHQCVFRPGSSELFVCDLGNDEIAVYNQGEESGLIIRSGTIAAPAGSGPRHILFLSRDCFLLVTELGNTVLRYVCENEVWTPVQSLSTLPADCDGESYAAAIRRFGKTIFVSNRGHNSISVFRLDAHDALTRETIIPIHGDFPRDILPIGAEDILCANQKSGTVEWISKGKTVCEAAVPGAVCLTEFA